MHISENNKWITSTTPLWTSQKITNRRTNERKHYLIPYLIRSTSQESTHGKERPKTKTTFPQIDKLSTLGPPSNGAFVHYLGFWGNIGRINLPKRIDLLFVWLGRWVCHVCQQRTRALNKMRNRFMNGWMGDKADWRIWVSLYRGLWWRKEGDPVRKWVRLRLRWSRWRREWMDPGDWAVIWIRFVLVLLTTAEISWFGKMGFGLGS